jgi:Putative MetA-pathway of phenol degradation
LDLSETLVRFGISDRTELRFVAPNYFEALTGQNSDSGFGDFALGIKQQLGPLPGDVDLAVIVASSLPTGATRISSHGYDPGELTFHMEKQITKPWDVFAEYGGDFAQTGGSKEVAHFGTAYKITPKNQVDFHFGFGMSQVTPGRFFAVGYSFRLDNVWGRTR